MLSGDKHVVEIAPFNARIAISFYDAGLDLDRTLVFDVRINENGIEIENVDDKAYLEYFDNTRRLRCEVFSKLEEIIKLIDQKRCPICGRKMKVVRKRRYRRKSVSGRFLKACGYDASDYDVKEEFFFTCFKCDVKCERTFETWDGKTVLNWSYKITKNGKTANYTHYGYFNEEKYLHMNLRFLRELFEMGLVVIKK